VTVPILTPLKLTGAPILSPPTEPSKNRTKARVCLKIWPAPNASSAMTVKTAAPTTKAPMTLGSAFLLMIFVPPFVKPLS
jgi:hypothetical protein